MKKFTEIGQFRNVIRAIKDTHDYLGKDMNDNPIIQHLTPYPTLRFRGTIKNHGTNSGIACYKNDDGSVRYEFQSRERVLTLISDNAGFMNAMIGKDYKKLFEGIYFTSSCVIYGEWIGQGIQANVAISKIPKSLIIFAVRIDDVYKDMENFKHLKNEEQRIFNILQFPTYTIDIDFNEPELSQNKIIDLTLEVENCCPVGKYFGIEGIGEGIVFEHIDGDTRYIFKSKGVKHSGKSKVKTLHVIDDVRLSKIREIAEIVTPEWRLSQMVEQSCDLNNGGSIDRSKLGDYLRMVIADIQKEDLDIIIEAGLEPKEINKAVSEIAKAYFFDHEKI